MTQCLSINISNNPFLYLPPQFLLLSPWETTASFLKFGWSMFTNIQTVFQRKELETEDKILGVSLNLITKFE